MTKAQKKKLDNLKTEIDQKEYRRSRLNRHMYRVQRLERDVAQSIDDLYSLIEAIEEKERKKQNVIKVDFKTRRRIAA